MGLFQNAFGLYVSSVSWSYSSFEIAEKPNNVNFGFPLKGQAQQMLRAQWAGSEAFALSYHCLTSHRQSVWKPRVIPYESSHHCVVWLKPQKGEGRFRGSVDSLSASRSDFQARSRQLLPPGLHLALFLFIFGGQRVKDFEDNPRQERRSIFCKGNGMYFVFLYKGQRGYDLHAPLDTTCQTLANEPLHLSSLKPAPVVPA